MGGKYSKISTSEPVSKKPDVFDKTRKILEKIDRENNQKGHLRNKSVSVKPGIVNYGTVKSESASSLVTPSDLRGSHDDPNYKLQHALNDTYSGTQGAA